jgi:hypothetical protein
LQIHAIKEKRASPEDFDLLVASLRDEYTHAKNALWNEIVRTLQAQHLHDLARKVILMREVAMGPWTMVRAQADVDDQIARARNDYVDKKHEVWNDVMRALTTLHEHVLASELRHMKERGISLARLTKLCHPKKITEPGVCRRALDDYYHLARGIRRSDILRLMPPKTMTLNDFLGDDEPSYYKRFAEDALHKLWRLEMDVSVLLKDMTNMSAFEYSFYLLKSGEPEHVAHSKNEYIDFDFVPTGKEVMIYPTQVGGMEVTVNVLSRKIDIDLFGKDKTRVLPKGENNVTAMRYFMCASLAALCADLQVKEEIFHYKVQLDAADKGDGKLFEYYRGFGFTSNPQFQSMMTASMSDIVHRCSRF